MSLYHGTDRWILNGTIEPRYDGWAYATTDLETAQSFGENVYLVTPISDIEHDPDMDNEPGSDFRSRTGFRVLERIEV